VAAARGGAWCARRSAAGGAGFSGGGVYALAVALFVYRGMQWRGVYGVLVRAARTTAIVMVLCAGAQVASYMIELANLPNVLTAWLGPLVEHPCVGGRDDAGAHRQRAGPQAHDPDPARVKVVVASFMQPLTECRRLPTVR
jgi:Tripartite ATP-independent periplasmic transporter, DctM component